MLGFLDELLLNDQLISRVCYVEKMAILSQIIVKILISSYFISHPC